MCEQHEFRFDVDKAYSDQVASALEASPEHALSDPQAPRNFGIYALYRASEKDPVYVGQAVGSAGLAGRLRDHLRKVDHRIGISVTEMTCRYLIIHQKWEVARAEDALISRNSPPWNGIPGFSMHTPGRGRPGMPEYRNEWDRTFPPSN